MNWHEAVEACKKLGQGWRLPTKDELNMFYENKEEVGGFDYLNYWSSTEVDYVSAWRQYFGSGNQGGSGKYTAIYVRAVRAS